MKHESSTIKLFRPSRIHNFFRWIDHLPGPFWLYYLAVVILLGIVNLVVAWYEKAIDPGVINWYYASTALLLGLFAIEIDFMSRFTKDLVDEFLPGLDMPDEEKELIKYHFTYLPSRPTAIIFWVGAIIGLIVGWIFFPSAIEMNQSFPLMELPIFSLTWGVMCITIFFIVRAFALTKKAYQSIEQVNIYDLTSLYAISRYPAWLLLFFIANCSVLFGLNPTLMESMLLFFLIMNALVVILIFSTFWVPMRRINRILISEKRKLLNEVIVRIDATFKILHERVDKQETSRINELRETLQSLMIEKEFIDSLRTWPWKPGTLTGLLSMLLFPLLAGIVIEIISKLIK